MREAVVLHLAPVLDIDLHPRRVLVLRLEQAVEQELDVFEQRAVAADEPVLFRGIDLRVSPCSCSKFLDLADEAEQPEHRIQRFLGVQLLIR